MAAGDVQEEDRHEAQAATRDPHELVRLARPARPHHARERPPEQVGEEPDEGDVNTYQGAVQMRYNLLFTQVAKMQVPCNPNLKAGDIVKCNLEIITPGKKEQGDADPVESGNYMILDLCHHYDTERSFTAMTLVRDTYGLYTNKS